VGAVQCALQPVRGGPASWRHWPSRDPPAVSMARGK